MFCAHRPCRYVLSPSLSSLVLKDALENDWDIQHSHSSVIFNAFLDPYLPESPSMPKNPLLISNWDVITAQQAARADQRRKLVTHTDVHNFGIFDHFISQDREIVLLKTVKGGHDIGRIEGVQDAIGRMFGLV